MEILQMTSSYVRFDAVGNDLELIHRRLSDEGISCHVYAEGVGQKVPLETIDADQVINFAQEPKNVIIYHHSIAFPFAEKLFEDCKARIIFRYHNVTPPNFFEGYSPTTAQMCRDGEEQSIEFAKKYSDKLWICASHFNATNIDKYVPRENIEVLAPFNKLHEWGKENPDEELFDKLSGSDAINLLFVGRVAPNKGHKKLLETVRCYKENYNKDIVLWIVGVRDQGIPKYNFMMDEYIKKYGLQKNVKFAGQINDHLLIAYYRGCDIFLCASEHEGFGVPIVEAQYFGIPVVAMESSAVGETLGKEQVLIENAKATELAAAIDVLISNKEYKKYIIQKGKENFYERFSQEKLNERLMGILKKHGVV